MNKKEERITCLIPCTMLPSKQAFMDLGFTFREIDGTNLWLATLPEGWSSVADKFSLVTLIDEKGRPRGRYIYEPDSNSFMELSKRFYIICVDENPDNKIYSFFSFLHISVKDSATKKTIFDAGICNSEDQVKKNQLINKCHSFLNDRYPNWENPNQYWNLEEP